MTRPRLSKARLDDLRPGVERPVYEPADQHASIVHLGVGAFHRAHQAVYTDDAMNIGERDWRITGVSLRSAGVRDELVPQDSLYTVTQRDADGATTRLIGSVADVLFAPEDPVKVTSAIADPVTRIVSLTVTEKAYCRAGDGSLDANHPDVSRDLRGRDAPVTIYGFLAEGLARRRDAGTGGLTVLSCDNLAHNGATLDALLTEFLEHRSPDLAKWYTQTCACPSTMVDRIVPAPTAAERDAIASAIGLFDAAAIVTEPFRQWVIEDSFAAGRPAWEQVGAELVSDVAAYEAAKLRMLNGAHSSLAYQGLLLGHTYVHEAIADERIRPIVEQLMRDEAAPSLKAAPGQDLKAYADSLLRRFENPALAHRLEQIAMDGSQKVPQRWLETLRDRQAVGAACPAILRSLAAWTVFARGDRFTVSDPLADTLARICAQTPTEAVVRDLVGPGGLLSTVWNPLPADVHAIRLAVDALTAEAGH